MKLTAICCLFAVLSTIGITWGLPSRDIDKYLFGKGEPWTGETIYRLAKAEEKFDSDRGADVDADPLAKDTDEPVLLTESVEDLARIYLRYRLYTYQPDEMITMMSLSGMSPGQLDFDPRLYQYGGLFIYPIGALIKVCDILGLIDVRSDVTFYLDNPEEFGKFYIVARAYSAAWGLVGVLVVFAIARRLAQPGGMAKRSAAMHCAVDPRPGVPDRTTPPDPGATGPGAPGPASDVGRVPPAETTASAHLPNDGNHAGLLAALLFALMPVVVCMAHEGKPHLPGAVLMLAAVLFAMRYLKTICPPGLGDPRATGPGATTKRNAAVLGVIDPRPGVPDRATPGATGPGAPGPASAIGRVSPAETIHSRTARTAGLNRRDWLFMCICCGAAFGMVLSSWPIFVLIPLVAWMAGRQMNANRVAAGETRPTYQPESDVTGAAGVWRWFKQTVFGTIVGIVVYLAANPYVLINALFHHEVLRSNLDNSFAMYPAARIGEGLIRVLELTIEGATLPVLVFGAAAFVLSLLKRKTLALPLIIAATIFFVQFVMIGAGKPGEYGRFGIFANTALAIGAAVLLTVPLQSGRPARGLLTALLILWTGTGGYLYLANFRADATSHGSRLRARRVSPHGPGIDTYLDPWTALHQDVGLIAEPAPYSAPPLPFDALNVYLFPGRNAARAAIRQSPARWIALWTADETDPALQRPSISAASTATAAPSQDKLHFLWPTPISWANKPIEIHGLEASFAP